MNGILGLYFYKQETGEGKNDMNRTKTRKMRYGLERRLKNDNQIESETIKNVWNDILFIHISGNRKLRKDKDEVNTDRKSEKK